MSEQLKDLLPDAKTRRIMWNGADIIPKEEDYLLSLKENKKTARYEKGSLYVVVNVRKVKTKNPLQVKHDLTVIRCQDLIDEVKLMTSYSSTVAFLHLKRIIVFVWESRNKKK